jgi:oligopeptide/dipeptide ABC transporter ATP-binding protein
VTEAKTDAAVVLRLEGLSTHFATPRGVVKALDEVDLEVRSGETLGIVGESGSGKTMTALSIMGLVPEPSGRIVGGHIWFDGEDLVTKTPREMAKIRGRRITMIPQDPLTSLNPVYTVGNQMLESIRMVRHEGAAAARSRAADLLTDVNIADAPLRLGDYPHRMSGGMRQRVVGAIALVGTPAVLIADEPTTSLDATVQLQYLQLLRRLQKEHGMAIIFITHDFGVVAKMCDRVAVMYAGRIVEVSKIRDLFNNPAHPYTKALIESLPSTDRDLELLPTIGGQPPELEQLPPGCSFSPRCRHAFDRCREAPQPPDFVVADDHSARCWLLEHTDAAPND